MDKRHKTAAEIGSKTLESTETPAEVSVIAEDVTSTAATPTAGNIPAEYLRGGYYKGEGAARYISPDLVGIIAQTIAKALADGGLKQTAINSILRGLKRADKKTLPLDAKRGALTGAIVTAKQLHQRKHAPTLLVDILECNRAAVQDGEDYKAAVKHLTAVGVYLGDFQQ